ncbi:MULTISPECIES: site-specific integrase [Rhizobium]|uniref:Integrase n=1 Tax=Rhizobium metallidurans TaxID=1265931 RepID=A0A7W6CRE5_9HYPH|nr:MULTISPECIES: site-specific integrase [Rhizobium]MBB3965805.1 integrase [Rhizobium metallidurans]
MKLAPLHAAKAAIESMSGDQVLHTVDGHAFIPMDDVWVVATPSGPASFNFNNLPGASPELRQQIKDVCRALLVSAAPSRASQALTAYRVLIRFLAEEMPGRAVEMISLRDVLRYGASLKAKELYKLRRLKEHLLLWVDLGIGGLDDDLLIRLPDLETKHHEVGAAVRTLDPETGPLTDMEYENLLSAIRNAFTEGKLTTSNYTLLMLAITLGARPLQLAMLKCGDFTVSARQDNSKIFILQVTRIKQGKGIRPRTIFRPRELAPALGTLIQQQCDEAREWAVAHDVAPEVAPIFLSDRSSINMGDIGLRGHHSGKSMAEKLRRLLKDLAVTSHRTGRKLHLFQSRIRRTLGTRAAAEGHSASVIADLLDHSWIDSSLIYVETRPAMMERIDKALALQLAPVAQAFAGTLVMRQDTDRGRIIHTATRSQLESVGTCGKHDYCRLAAPLACYTCTFFNPWLDAPHESLLDSLLQEREILANTADLRIAAVNDLTILAVADLVRKCGEMVGRATK